MENMTETVKMLRECAVVEATAQEEYLKDPFSKAEGRYIDCSDEYETYLREAIPAILDRLEYLEAVYERVPAKSCYTCGRGRKCSWPCSDWIPIPEREEGGADEVS